MVDNLIITDTGQDQFYQGIWCQLWQGQDDAGEIVEVLVATIQALKAVADPGGGRPAQRVDRSRTTAEPPPLAP